MAKLLSIFIGTIGVRLDRPEGRWWRLFAWLGMISGYYAIGTFWIGDDSARLSVLRALSLWYAFAVWILYYGVLMAGILGTGVSGLLISRFGESRSYLWYQAILGLTFLNQGFTQTVMSAAFGHTLSDSIPEWMTYTVGAAFIAVGTTFKLWSAYITGLDTYYYRDMFLGRRGGDENADGLVVSGPYRYFKNPMYGIGNLHTYGAAIWSRSWQGLMLAALFQCSMYAFYFFAERPFVRKTYEASEGSCVPSTV